MPPSLPPETLLAPLRRLLRPLVRLLIRCGVTFPAAAELLRALFVEVAGEELGARRNDSRMSLLTGIHRKEIRRQRELPPDAPPPALINRNAALIATWLGAPGYADEAGRPRPLARTGPAPSFDHLVASVTRDVRSRAVLEDWLAQQLVTLDAEDRVHLVAEAFVPQPGQAEQLFYFGRNLHDHLAAAAANVLADGAAPFLDRSVHYDRLTPDAAVALEQAARAAAGRVLLEINREALALASEEASPGTPTRRVNVGVFVFAEDDPPA